MLAERAGIDTFVLEREGVEFQSRPAPTRLRGPHDQDVQAGGGEGSRSLRWGTGRSVSLNVNDTPWAIWRPHDNATVVCALLRFRKISWKFFLDSRQ